MASNAAVMADPPMVTATIVEDDAKLSSLPAVATATADSTILGLAGGATRMTLSKQPPHILTKQDFKKLKQEGFPTGMSSLCVFSNGLCLVLLSSSLDDESFLTHTRTHTDTHSFTRSIKRWIGALFLIQTTNQGLSKSMAVNNIALPLRIWVIDNSGSMSKPDGHRLVDVLKRKNAKLVSCTRWAEIQQTVNCHSELAASLRAPTIFRLLNNPRSDAWAQQFTIAEDVTGNLAAEVENARSIMGGCQPGGVTPLTKHVNEIRDNVLEIRDDLVATGGRVAVILATDGIPTNRRGYKSDRTRAEFVEALRSLEGLPVWLIIRLCTDDEDVVNFYNDLDQQLELSLEVLDDFVQEAWEIYRHNKWLNYALPLHRCREMGCHNRLFDFLDERSLTLDELRDFLCFLFGDEAFSSAPHPHTDWKGFAQHVDRVVRNEQEQWNPVKQKVMPWINMKKLNKMYGGGKCTIM